MSIFGIYTRRQFDALGPERRFSGVRAAYNFLDVGDNPTPEDVRAFEDASFVLQTSNGTFRTSFRNRFTDLDLALDKWIARLPLTDGYLRVQDRAVSHGLTATEWAKHLEKTAAATGLRQIDFEASDLLLELIELTLPDGAQYICEIDGTPLQYIRPPFVVAVRHREARSHLIARVIAALGKRRFRNLGLPPGWADTSGGKGYSVKRISCIHPEAAALVRAGRGFHFVRRSVFDCTPNACNVLRTMNILNRSYFSAEQLAAAEDAVFQSLAPGGIWVVGRTLEEDFSNHVSILRRGDTDWTLLERLGQGSEIEELALEARRSKAS